MAISFLKLMWLEKVSLTVRLLKPGPLRQWKPDGRTETIDSNIFKSSQSNVLFSNPANQTSGTKQWNLNLFVAMLAITISAINCQIVRKFYLTLL